MNKPVLAMLAVAVAVALSASACKKTDVTCTDPPEKRPLHGDLGEDGKRMAEAASRDPSFCRELATPRITLANDELVLSGPKERRIARRAELSPDELHGVDRLYESLRSYASQLMEVNPSNRANKRADIRLDPSLETARAASILFSVAYAGYEDAQLTTGAMTFPLLSYRTSPPDARFIWSILHVEATSDGAVTVDVRGPVCKRSKPITVPNRELGPLVARICAENKRTPDPSDTHGDGPDRTLTHCFDSVEVRALPHASFGETAAHLRAIVAALADQKPRIDLALLLVGSEPRMKGFPHSPRGTLSMYAPGVDGSAYCTLPDGGYDPHYDLLDAGPFVYD